MNGGGDSSPPFLLFISYLRIIDKFQIDAVRYNYMVTVVINDRLIEQKALAIAIKELDLYNHLLMIAQMNVEFVNELIVVDRSLMKILPHYEDTRDKYRNKVEESRQEVIKLCKSISLKGHRAE